MSKSPTAWIDNRRSVAVSTANAGVTRLTQTSVTRLTQDGTTRVLSDNVVTPKAATSWA